MSSNIRITRICEQCGNQFEARKTTTKTCSDNCAKRRYKAQKRNLKIEASNSEVQQVIDKPIENLKNHEFLTIDETALLIRISRRTLYRLIDRNELSITKLGRRSVIRRSDVDNLFLK